MFSIGIAKASGAASVMAADLNDYRLSLAKVMGADDIMAPEDYVEIRAKRRRIVSEAKRRRRLAVGPDITFYFENYITMLHQVHEMLYIEKGGESQIVDELAAYNPLIPQGRELVTTMMIEIDDPHRRARVLAELGGIEKKVRMLIGDENIAAVAETDVDRTDAAGKTSSIHFLRFPLTDAQIIAFRESGVRVVLVIEHTGYSHMAIMPDDVRRSLGEDLD